MPVATRVAHGRIAKPAGFKSVAVVAKHPKIKPRISCARLKKNSVFLFLTPSIVAMCSDQANEATVASKLANKGFVI